MLARASYCCHWAVSGRACHFELENLAHLRSKEQDAPTQPLLVPSARASMKRRIARVEQHIERHLSLLDEADQEEPSARDMKVPELEEKIASLKARMQRLKKREREVLAHGGASLQDTEDMDGPYALSDKKA